MSGNDLHAAAAAVANSTTSASTAPSSADDITPFPSPMLTPQSMAGLSLSSDGEWEHEVDELRVVTDEDRAAALELKAQANKAYGAKDFGHSIDLYTQAIKLNPHDSVFWNNRAMSKAKMEEHGAAIADATKAIELKPDYAKAYYRRGVSSLAIVRPKDAVPDFKKALEIEPSNRVVREQLNATVKLIRRIEFEKAISVGETETASQRCLTAISHGACGLDGAKEEADGITLPILPDDPTGRYTPTKEFVDAMIETFKAGGKMPKRVVWEIVLGVKAIVDRESSLVEVTVPEGVSCDIVGDTHGQFYDVYNLLSIITPPSENHMVVFNGDFVDRGSWSIEVVLTLFAYKWLYPDRVFLNRGNHETNDMNKVYGFEGECKAKHGEMTYQLFADVFTALPLATLLSAGLPPSSLKSEGSKPAILGPDGHKRYFVVHGGPPVSKDGVLLEEIAAIDRYGRQPGQEGLMCELLWTDPQDMPGRGPSKRGVGLGFGPDVTRRWCELNKVTAVIRSHEVRQDGYAIEHDGLCITTFSCPNYCDSTGNQAAYVHMEPDGELSYHQFAAVPHPDVRPMAYSAGFNMMGL
ncbi:hypothetical protein CspeluHIS016_0504130 [Cutaneotrichosporon spelunceum]|uniref:Serine/threonine-protein phosphatase n=1 Tax=Cutaneotrichosporon spelunceum TaxID=1672016 RepID=A0AAD3TXK0_9TREE|nr:hypothetical protein CspeluHIS016_0504130 [Cutaneotrichosporon spelunceum]